MNLTTLGTSYKWNRTVFVFLSFYILGTLDLYFLRNEGQSLVPIVTQLYGPAASLTETL